MLPNFRELNEGTFGSQREFNFTSGSSDVSARMCCSPFCVCPWSVLWQVYMNGSCIRIWRSRPSVNEWFVLHTPGTDVNIGSWLEVLRPFIGTTELVNTLQKLSTIKLSIIPNAPHVQRLHLKPLESYQQRCSFFPKADSFSNHFNEQ